MWKGVPRNEDPVYTVCGLEECIPCDDVSDPANGCEDYASENNCNDAKCSWCKSAAVKAACRNPEDAAKLPAAVFDCSNLPAEIFLN